MRCRNQQSGTSISSAKTSHSAGHAPRASGYLRGTRTARIQRQHSGLSRTRKPPAQPLQLTGRCQAPRVYQPSQRVLPAPCQKTIWVEPSTVTVALGEEVSMPLPPKAELGQSTGAGQLPRVYQDSWRWPAAVREKTSWVEPSGVTVTLGGELIAPNCMGPCQLPRAYQSSVSRLLVPWKKTSCWEPSGVMVALGEEAREPRLVKSAGPCQPPAEYQASPRWPSVPRQKTSSEPSVVVTTEGAEPRMA